MDPNKEWYTIQELAEIFGVNYSKVRGAVFALKNAGVIVARDNPIDARVVEISKQSIDVVRRAVLGS